MRVNWYKNIKFRIALGFSLVFMAFVFAGNLYIYHHISDRLTRADDAYLLSRAQTLLDKTEAYPIVIPLPGRDENMIISLYEYGSRSDLFRSPALQTLKQPGQKGIAEADTFRLATVSRNLDNSDSYIRLSLIKSSHPLAHEKRVLLVRLFLISLAAILLAAFTAYFIAVFLLRPIRSIIQSAQKISAQNEHAQVPVPDTHDEVYELAVTLNEMLGRIDEASRQQNAFFTSASHQLKTPLAIMKAELEVAGKQETDSKRLQQMMLSQLDEVNDLQRIVQEFLWAGQIRARTLKLNLKPCMADEVLLKTIRKMQRLIQAAGIKVDVNYPETPPGPVLADEEKLAMVFANLIENAMKYADRHELRIRMQESGSFYCIEFTSWLKSGDQIKRGIQSFEGAETGLGLWLSKQIMTLHNGDLKLKTSQERHFMIQVLLPADSKITL